MSAARRVGDDRLDLVQARAGLLQQQVALAPRELHAALSAALPASITFAVAQNVFASP